jgi:hypothetical protein
MDSLDQKNNNYHILLLNKINFYSNWNQLIIFLPIVFIALAF